MNGLQVAIFQTLCTRIKGEVLENVVGGSAWAALKAQCVEKLLLDLETKMFDMMGEAAAGELITQMLRHSVTKATLTIW